jgi:prolyl-tRNA synthetase
MKQSQLFTKTQKDALKDEVSINAQLLIRAGFIDKEMAGVYSILPLGLRVMNKIENIIREEINALGGQEIFMPTLQPKENWLKTGRWDTMDDLYKVKDASGREAALGPTHEEIVVPLAQKFINSYRDFPFSVYQFQNKFRMELRAKSGILRGREFIMKDLYSFHLDEKDLDAFYERSKAAYFNIFERAGTERCDPSDFCFRRIFSKYSHEFQAITSAGEDIIYVCTKVRFGGQQRNKKRSDRMSGMQKY